MKSHPARVFGRSTRPDAGFTAVEMAMVATVIAIIALLVLPIFRQRAEAARQAAVLDELASLAKAILLVEADTGIQPRLQDLDNGRGLGVSPAEGTPIAAWNGTLESVIPISRATIDANWEGPYASAKNFRFVRDLHEDTFLRNYLYQGSGSPGFIYIVGNGYQPAFPGPGGIVDDWNSPSTTGLPGDRYPVDPWGQPYIFYGQGRFPANSTESVFNTSVLYSLGPDGIPGTDTVPFQRADSYRRPTNDNLSTLGLGDDIEYRF
jgi:type II secretory pathway pseudopilin PulG